MSPRKKSVTFKQAAPLIISGVKLAYDIAEPATCPTCGNRVYVFVCLKCPKVVMHPVKQR